MNDRLTIGSLAACTMCLFLLPGAGRAQETAGPEAEVRQVLERAYVDGLHVRRDEAAVRAGFHPDFVMTVRGDDGIFAVSLDAWLERLGLDGQPNPLPVEGRFALADVTGKTAIAKVEIHEDGEHVYTDYFGLYEGPDGWKIVNKIFQSDPASPTDPGAR